MLVGGIHWFQFDHPSSALNLASRSSKHRHFSYLGTFHGGTGKAVQWLSSMAGRWDTFLHHGNADKAKTTWQKCMSQIYQQIPQLPLQEPSTLAAARQLVEALVLLQVLNQKDTEMRAFQHTMHIVAYYTYSAPISDRAAILQSLAHAGRMPVSVI